MSVTATDIVVDECVVRVVMACPWFELDRDAIVRSVQRIISERLLADLLGAGARRGLALGDAVVSLRLRTTVEDLHRAAAGDGRGLALNIEIDRAVAASLSTIAPRVEFVAVPTEEPDSHAGEERSDPALWTGLVTARATGSRHRGPPRSRQLRREAAATLPSGHRVPSQSATWGSPRLDARSDVVSDTTIESRMMRVVHGRDGVRVVGVPRSDDAPEVVSAQERSLVLGGSAGIAVGRGVDAPHGLDTASSSFGHHVGRILDAPPSTRRPMVPVDQGVRGQVAVRSVLPFLVLVSLDQLGLLDELVDALAESRAEDLVPDVVAALSRKVLRTVTVPSDPPTDNVVAGLLEAPSGSRLELAERSHRDWMEHMVERVFAAVRDGRAADDALVAASVVGRRAVTLATSEGLFPLAWHAHARELGTRFAGLGSPNVVADARARALLPRDVQAPDGPCALARRLRLTQQRLDAQRAVPWTTLPHLERGLAVIASVALADIAHRVFAPLGPTDSVQSLDHFGDLDGHVSFGENTVTVSMAVGRRHGDLRDNGLLESIHNVPWLGGRSIELVGA